MLKKRNLLFLLIIAFTGSFFACSDDDDYKDLLEGTWELIEITENNVSQPLDSKPGFIHFIKNKYGNIFRSYQVHEDGSVTQVNDGWSISGNMLNIAGDLPAAYYIEQVNGNSLVLKRLDFDKENGNILTTYYTYRKVSEDKIPVVEEDE